MKSDLSLHRKIERRIDRLVYSVIEKCHGCSSRNDGKEAVLLEKWIFSQIKAAEVRGRDSERDYRKALAESHLVGPTGTKALTDLIDSEPLGPGLPVSVGSSEKK